MSAIRIIKMPSGSAPEHIRQEWVDLEIGLAHPPGAQDPDKYYVTGSTAVQALRNARKDDAAEYWRSVNSSLVFLAFNKQECEYLA